METETSRALSSARGAALVAGAAILARVVWWGVAPPVSDIHAFVASGRAPVGGWTVDRLVVAGAASALLVVAAVLLALITLNVAGVLVVLRSAAIDRVAAQVSPRWLRRCVLAVCGCALATPGFTAAAEAHDDGRGRADVIHLTGLALPDLPSVPSPRVVIVRPGDTLWSIARHELHPDATDRAIAARVMALYAANRSTIGHDPNLIFPGQRLTAPGGAS